MSKIGEFIAERRNAKGWSKRKLAEVSGVSHAEIHRIENGERQKPSVILLNKIAPVLGVSAEEMIKIAGYVTGDEFISPIQRAFPDLKTPVQQETVRKIVDGLARSEDLKDRDYEQLVDQVEMFLNHVKEKNSNS